MTNFKRPHGPGAVATTAKTIDTGSPLARGSVPFVKLSEYGELGDKGKAVFKMSGFGRIVGNSERPLTSIAVPLLAQLISLCHYDSVAQLKEDLATLRRYLDLLEPKEKKK